MSDLEEHFKGYYKPKFIYEAGDLVWHNEAMWRCTVEPERESVPPTEGPYWERVQL